MKLGKVARFQATVIAAVCLVFSSQIVQSLPLTAGDIGSGVYHAGIIGNYAGQLIGNQALSELHQNTATKAVELHDFSEGAAENSASLYESLGHLGDNLERKSFPNDYGAETYNEAHNGAAATEYAEEGIESQVAASEHHEDIEALKHEAHTNYIEHEDEQHLHAHELHKHENEIDFGAHFQHDFGGDDEFFSKPVPGIDHGKGAFSYSSTYEFKDPKP